jgi:putative tryptophan/tyrosine transport system substrate-binding protein
VALVRATMAAAITGMSALWTPAARAAKQAKSAIPIVAIAMADSVADDLVATLAQPGGNVTGTTFLGPELVAKRLQLLKEVVPGLSLVAALWASHAYSERTMAGLVKEVEVTARTLGMQLQLAAANSPDEIAGALATVIRERAEALIVFAQPIQHHSEQSFTSNWHAEGIRGRRGTYVPVFPN